LISRSVRTTVVPCRIANVPSRGITRICRRGIAQAGAIVVGGIRRIGRPIIGDGITSTIEVVGTSVPAATVRSVSRQVRSAVVSTI
jgi:hypothetical protein